jgi:signal transduction histidine kinase/CheY-like chemotaxis protein
MENHSVTLDTYILPLMLVNSDNIIIEVNSPLTELLDISASILLEKNLFQTFLFENEISVKSIKLNIEQLEPYVTYNVEYTVNNDDIKKLALSKSKTDTKNNTWVTLALDYQRESPNELANNQLLSLNQVSDIANISTWELSLDFKHFYCSDTFKELICIPKKTQLTWNDFRRVIFIDDLPFFDSFFLNHIAHALPLNFEFRMMINEDIRWLEINADTLDKTNHALGIKGTLKDCTKNKVMLNALNDAIEGKKMAMKAGGIGTWHAELKRNNKWSWYWDVLTTDMFGLDLYDLYDGYDIKKLYLILHPDDKEVVRQAIKHSQRTGQRFSQKYRAIMPNGEIRYFQGEGQVGQDIQGKNCRLDGICIDHSAIHQAQIELRKLNSELEGRVEQRTNELVRAKEHAEQASKIKSDFLAIMSHELRTPMNGVIGSLDLLTYTQQTEESMDLINTSKTSAENLVFILNDILDINKIEAGKLEIEDRAFSISEIIDNIVKVFIPVAQKSNIFFNVYEEARIPLFVSGDAMRVRQILFNLIGNALKFTSTTAEKVGCIDLQAIVVESNAHVCTVSFNIIDNGIGINRETQQKLFMPFSQADRSTTRKYGGTGLGLAICAKLTEMMGGAITLESKEGEGSSFCVEVPFWLSQETKALDIACLSSVNIAIVDIGELENNRLNTLSLYLEAEGAEVNIVNCDLTFDFSSDFDLTIIFINSLSADNKKLKAFVRNISHTNKIILATHDVKLDKTRAAFPDLKLISMRPITRVQFVDIVIKTWQQRNDLILDDLDLSELELEFDIEPVEEKSTIRENDILIVEDNKLNQKLIIKQMEQLGYSCDLADDGEFGLKKWQENNYKLILTDCHMPNLDGYQMTIAIRKKEQIENRLPTPIIAITGAAMNGDADKCYKVGMNGFVSKPVQISHLKTMLKEWYSHE